MAKSKACKNCKLIYEGDKCPNCESKESTDGWKGRITVLNEESDIAKKMGIKKKGTYAIKTK